MKKKTPVDDDLMGMSNAITPDIRKRRQRYRNKRKLRAYLLVSVSAVVLFFSAVLIYSFMGASVIETVTIEAGDDMVSASDFFGHNVRAFFISGGDIDTSKPGKYELTVRNGILFHKVTLNVRDTVAPTAKPRHIRIRQGKKDLSPYDFVKNISDMTEVTASFKTPINYDALGDSDVTVILRDLGGNETEYDTKITIYPEALLTSVTVEAGYAQLSVRDFLAEGAEVNEGDTILTPPDESFFHKVGSQKTELLYSGTVYTVELNVEDTVPPKASIMNLSTFKGKPLEPSDFVEKFKDETRVSVEYAEKPDFDKTGTSVIELILEDGGRNTSVYKAILTVKEDTVKPEITAENRTVYIGDNIRFSEGVKATDNCDGEIEVKVDIGDFDKETPGVYPIKFTATDKAGNTAEKTVDFTLAKKQYYLYTQEVIDSLFKPLYSRLINDGMTDREKLRAIYDYVRENISYNGTSEKSDWEQEAYRGLRSKQGDAFTFYAISRKLITMAGIENKAVERKGSDFSHYWNMVMVDGEWYHFDTCPHYKDYPIDSFLLTDKEVAEYSKKTNGYYTYK